MKDKFLNIIIVILLLTIWIQYVFPQRNDSERFKIVPAGNMLTILVDQQTGETWRNCLCSKEYQVPGCWEKMHHVDEAEFNLPVGEKIVRKKELKMLEKLKKKQYEAQKASKQAGIAPKQTEPQQLGPVRIENGPEQK